MTYNVTLECLECGKKRRAPRTLNDPDGTTKITFLKCDDCDRGGDKGAGVRYWDFRGAELFLD